MDIIVPINAKTDINIMDVFKKSRNQRRIEFLRTECRRKFDGVVHNCCKVSANNHKVAFAIHRSVFGYPMVEQIERPNDVMLHEKGDCVVVKDGYAYELTKRAE